MSEATYTGGDPEKPPAEGADSTGGESRGPRAGGITIDTTYPRSIDGILKLVTVVSRHGLNTVDLPYTSTGISNNCAFALLSLCTFLHDKFVRCLCRFSHTFYMHASTHTHTHTHTHAHTHTHTRTHFNTHTLILTCTLFRRLPW